MTTSASDALLNSIPANAEQDNQPSAGQKTISKFLGGSQNPFDHSTSAVAPVPPPTKRVQPATPPANAPPVLAAAPADIASARAEMLEQAARRVDDKKDLYLRNLKNHDITLEEAQAAIDALLVTGEAITRQYPITKRISAVLRTRPAGAEIAVRAMLEASHVQTGDRYVQELARYHLAFSLVSIGDRVFPDPDPRVPNREVLVYLDNIPAPLFALLNNHLYDFEKRVNAILSPGYVENF